MPDLDLMVDAIAEKIKDKSKVIICDSASPALIVLLCKRGFNARPCLPKNKLHSIRLLCTYQLLITEQSYNIQDELYKYKWKDKAGEVPEDGNDHAIDPLGYYLRWYDYTY